MHTECTLRPHPRGWQSLGTWGWPCCGTTSLLQGAGLEPRAAGCLGGVMAPLWSRTPNSSDGESSKLSQLAVPAHCTSMEKRKLPVPRPWGPPQPLSRCPSVPQALGSEVLNLVSVPACLKIWFGRIGFSVQYDRSLSPCPMYPNPGWRGLPFCLRPPRSPPGEGDRQSSQGYCCYPWGLFRRHLICFPLAPSLIDQCCNLALC